MFALLLLYLLEAILLGFFRGMGSSDFIAIFLILLFSLFFISHLGKNRKLKSFTKPILLGYLFRLFLLLFDLYGNSIFVLPNSGADSLKYYHNAVWYADYGYMLAGGAFSRMMGMLMKICGTRQLFPQFAVMLFSMVSICFLTRLLMCYDNLEYAVKKKTIYVVSLLPNFAILSSIFLRESIVTMFITISLFFFVKWLKNEGNINFLFAFIFSFVGALYHSGSAAVAIGYIAAYLLYDRKEQRVRLKFQNIFVTIILVGIVAVLYIRYTDVFFAKMGNVEEITDIANTNTAGDSSYSQFVGNSNSIGSMIVYTIPRMIYFLFSPFPWQWRGISDIIAFMFSSVFYGICIIRAVIALKSNNQFRNHIIIISIVAMIVTFVFAWGVSNTGTAIRHRDKMVTIYALLFALSNNQRKPTQIRNKKRRRRVIV